MKRKAPFDLKKTINTDDKQNRLVSRREILSAMGVMGAAASLASIMPGSIVAADSDSVKSELKNVLPITVKELRSVRSSKANNLYYVTTPGQEGYFTYDPKDKSSKDNTGTVIVSKNGYRFKRVHDGIMNVSWFGAAGDGVTDDTQAIRDAIDAGRGKIVHFPPGVFRLTDTIEIPRNTFIRGSGNSSWFTFGQRRNELPDSILDMENGTVLKFEGNGSVRYSSNRSDFNSLTCAVKTESDSDGIQIHDLKILSSFRIQDETGNITTQLNDQHAMFDVGLWIDNGTHVKLERVSVVGYWQRAGCFLDAAGRLSTSNEFGSIEYATVNDCVFQGKIGFACLGGDGGNPPDETGFVPPGDNDELSEGRFGLSHLFVSNSFFSGTDHHSNGFASGWQDRIEPDSVPIKIDGFIGSGVPYRINHPRFVNCSIQTREHASIILDRVIRPTFLNCRAESGPIRASQYTVLPRLINCEFPYNRSNTDYQEIEHCQGAYIMPPFRRLGHLYLRDYHFHIELRNNNGVLEHRVTKPNALQSSAKCRDAEDLFRYAIKEAGWIYTTWSGLPIPGKTESDTYAKGMFLGEKSFISKYNLYTSVAIDNHEDYQEVELRIIESRAQDSDLWVRPSRHSASDVPYRLKNYSSTLKIEFRNGAGPATNLLDNLPNENDGQPSLVIGVRGKFYEQGYGLV
jgi:Pectate lyase superfamily protein